MQRSPAAVALVPLVTVVALGAVGSGCATDAAPRAVDGVLDLRHVEATNRPFRVQGAWEVYWGALRPAASFAPGPGGSNFLDAPAPWRGASTSDGTPVDDLGAVTLRARVLLPERDPADPWMVAVATLNRAYVLEVRDGAGQPLIPPLVQGRVGLDPSTTVHAHLGTSAMLGRSTSDELELVLQTAAFYGRAKAGRLWVTLGPATAVGPWLARDMQSALTVFGVTLVMGLYHLGLFLLRRSERSPLYFGLFCLAIAMREFVQFDLLEPRYPELDLWDLHNRLEYLGFFAAVPLFLAYLDAIFPEDFWRPLHRGVAWFTLVAGLAVLVVPMDRVFQILQVYEALTLGVVVYLVAALVRLLVRGEDAVLARLIGAGTLVLVFTVASDILSNTGLVVANPRSHYGVFAFIFVQSLVLAIRNQRARGYAETLATELDRKSAAFGRFVPRELLSLLGRRDVVDVELGDQSRRDMTVLFCDIRGFTAISERLGPAETFDLLNSCLGRIAPIIREHNGFVDKYIGDAVMALFPASPRDAIDAARAIIDAMAMHAHVQEPGGARIVSVGIGVHTGTMMLGTIGEPLRMEGTVISDAVNFASRLEGLTRQFGVAILVSADTVAPLGPDRVEHARSLGCVRVKGRQEAMAIFELYGADLPAIREAKHQSRAEFDLGVEHLRVGRFAEAERLFHRVCAQNPEDGPALLFARRCAELRQMARPWRGVLEFDEK